MSVEFTDWAVQILRRSHEAARRFNPDATVRMFREGAAVRFALTDQPEEGDERVQADGFELLVQQGLSGLIDVVEPHDQLVLRPGGSVPNPREPDHR
ncbi:MAG: hypothetical protein M3Q23_06880 [Actinomycetota bacterium]|nr:hypothetical protein [Actinomycetota bacterium]